MVSGDAQGFGWDAVGNRTNHSRAGLSYAIGLDPLANRNFTISGSTSRSFGYDAAGNLASDARPDRVPGSSLAFCPRVPPPLFLRRDEPDRPLGQIRRRYWFETRGNARGQLSSRNAMISGQTP